MITVRKKYLKTIVVTKPLLSVVSAVTLRRGSAHNDTCTVHQIKKKKKNQHCEGGGECKQIQTNLKGGNQ